METGAQPLGGDGGPPPAPPPEPHPVARPNFDPLAAIYDTSLQLDDVVAPIYDNIEACVAAVTGSSRKPLAVEKKPAVAEPPLQRRFLPEQMPVQRQRAPQRHLLTRMGEFVEGPLGRLRQLHEEKIKIKVWTRGIDNIRGVCSGFLVAFDKHWNMALRDVDEEFTRKRSRKSYVNPSVNDESKEEKLGGRKWLPQDLPVEVRTGFSVLKIVRIRGKFEVCQRHVAQVLLRGEHVVMVAQAS